MKKEYIIPKMAVRNFGKDEILTDSSATEKALRSGELKVNGKSLDKNSSIFSIEF